MKMRYADRRRPGEAPRKRPHTGAVIERVILLFAELCRPGGATTDDLRRVSRLPRNSVYRYLRWFRHSLPERSGLEFRRVTRRGDRTLSRYLIQPRGTP